MSRHILLDSYPLGLISHPKPDVSLLTWASECRTAGHKIYIPEIIDYEVRRELIRARKQVGVVNALRAIFTYIEITSSAMLYAADLWAKSRQGGLATGDPKKLDIDVILAAQALTFTIPTADSLTIATSNVSHLSRFVSADIWSNIAP